MKKQKNKTMAEKKDIKEGAYFATSEGRIGKAYAVSKRNQEEGTVNLFFEGPGCVFAGENFMPPSGIFKIEFLTKAKKPKK